LTGIISICAAALGFPSSLPLSGSWFWLGFLLCFVIVFIPLTGFFSVFFLYPFCSVKEKNHRQWLAGSRVLGAWSEQDSPVRSFVTLGKCRNGSLGMPQASQGWRKERFSHDSKPDRHQGQW